MSENKQSYSIPPAPDNSDRANDLSRRIEDEMGWGMWVIDIAVRAKFRCEYCDRDLLASADAYKEWQHDHIIPKRVKEDDGPNNMALSCRACNVNFKGKWDPSYDLPDNASRAELIRAARAYVAKKRTVAFEEVIKVRRIVYGE